MRLLQGIVLVLLLTGIQACKERSAINSLSSLVFVPVASPSNAGGQSQLHVSPDDHLYLSWIEYISDTTVELRYARWDTTQWDYIRTIAQGGSNWFVNWADMPSIAQFYPDRNRLVAHWLQYSGPGTYDYDVMLSSSSNAGLNWSAGSRLHRDTTQSEHGFVSMVALDGDQICAIWLDGRETQSGTDHTDHHHTGTMSLRSSFISDTGATSREYLLDDRVCDCCQTDAVYSDGQILVVYRDRSETEIRDISMVRHNGNQWEKPVQIGQDDWRIGGCPVNGPAIASGYGRVAVVWYTEADEQPKVQLVFSEDMGSTFGDPLIVDDEHPLGRVDIVFYDAENVLITWMKPRGEQACIMAKLISIDGNASEEFCLIENSASRQSGFPRLARSAGQLFISFTEVLESKTTRVQTGIIDVRPQG